MKKTKKGPYGAVFSAKEKKAMELEIKNQLAAWDEKHANEFDAIILWRLHEKFGFGHKRLKEFYDGFDVDIFGLIDRYELDDSDMIWICTHKLKEYGVDLDAWRKERDNKRLVRQSEDQAVEGTEDIS